MSWFNSSRRDQTLKSEQNEIHDLPRIGDHRVSHWFNDYHRSRDDTLGVRAREGATLHSEEEVTCLQPKQW